MQLTLHFLLAPAAVRALVLTTGEVTTDAEAQAVSARIDELWALAEQRYQARERPLRHLGCSYFVVYSRQDTDRAAYLSEAEAAEVHRLTLLHSLYVNDPARARERNRQRFAAYRRARRLTPAA